MIIDTNKLIDNLIKSTNLHLQRAGTFKLLTLKELNYKENTTSWSILECLEHLNLYSNYYLPAIEKAIKNNTTKPIKTFQSGWLGNYFTNLMDPKGGLKKMKTAKNKNPNGSKVEKCVIDTFITQQIELIEFLNKSKKINIIKTKTSISISKFIKLRLGDTFRFIIAHNKRHLLQAENMRNMDVN